MSKEIAAIEAEIIDSTTVECVIGWSNCTKDVNVEYVVDPCAFELHGDEDKYWICDNCFEDLRWEI